MFFSATHNKKQIILVKHLAFLVLAILLLIAGGIVYLSFRSMSLRMFGWFESLGLMGIVNELRSMCDGIHPGYFVLYNLPDLLWIVSYLLFVNAIIPKSDHKTYIFWVLLMPSMAICHEIMQGIGMAIGSFDLIDLLCYTIPPIINFLIINLTHFYYEKNL